MENSIMVDLETLGTDRDAPIISIGAVAFRKESGGWCINPNGFYQRVSIPSYDKEGDKFKISYRTLEWHLKGDVDLKEYTDIAETHDLFYALKSFSAWIGKVGFQTSPDVWGNGATFDNNILDYAYKASGLTKPWRYSGDRCYRTLAALRPDIKLVRIGTYHNALDDAFSQANHACEILNKLGV